MKYFSDINTPIVLVESEVQKSEPMESVLRTAGFNEIYSCRSWESAIERVDPGISPLLMIDMAGAWGIEVLREIRIRFPEIRVVMVNGENDVDCAVSCMKLGAADYLTRPSSCQRIIQTLKSITGSRRTDKRRVEPEEKQDLNLPGHCSSKELNGFADYLDRIINVDSSGSVPEEYREMLARFTDVMHGKKAYLDPDISLSGVAYELNTNIVYVRAFMKAVYNAHFRFYVNAMRIREFIRLLNMSGSIPLSIEGLSRTVGFSRRATFYEAFKKITGTTPGKILLNSVIDRR